jgi:hypothetical protein
LVLPRVITETAHSARSPQLCDYPTRCLNNCDPAILVLIDHRERQLRPERVERRRGAGDRGDLAELLACNDDKHGHAIYLEQRGHIVQAKRGHGDDPARQLMLPNGVRDASVFVTVQRESRQAIVMANDVRVSAVDEQSGIGTGRP